MPLGADWLQGLSPAGLWRSLRKRMPARGWSATALNLAGSRTLEDGRGRSALEGRDQDL